jgi:LacI family transcriptional regulator
VGLFALDDQLAAEAIEVCLDEGRRVPEDVAVVGVGNIALACETSHVPLTSVDLDSEKAALSAARLLDRLMRGVRLPARPIVVPPRGLVIRSSSSALVATHAAVARAVAFVNRRLAEPLDTGEMAAAAGVSRRTLYNLFAAELRRTPADFVRDERVARARRMLEEGTASVAAIARSCGFGTVRTLNRVFLSAEGMSPRAWRKGRQNPISDFPSAALSRLSLRNRRPPTPCTPSTSPS